MTDEIKFCPHCGAGLAVQGRFCTDCGGALTAEAQRLGVPGSHPRIAVNPKQLGVVAVLGLSVWAATWFIQDALTGTPPPQGPMASLASTGVAHSPSARASDPTLTKLREAVEANPSDLTAQRTLAAEILTRVRTAEEPSVELVMELVQVLGEILRQDGNDRDAIITMADLSFNQQVFDKAVAYYERFLKLEPDDHPVRARLGSALAFVGKYNRAEEELKRVLAATPDSFEASAYLAITYAQQGKTAEAIRLGEEALRRAPSDEARARFMSFLDSVRRPGASASVVGEVNPQSTGPRDGARREMPSEVTRVLGEIQGSSVAGPKFTRHELLDEGTTLVLFFNQFPMEAMPPAIRDRFLNKIKDAAAGGAVTTVSIRDAQTNSEMARLNP